MTVEEAKVILAAYRIGELDPADSATREALELVASDAELAAWWENEQAFDRVFARKLASVTPPRELAAIIMRGGATIFFARRLISDTTGETLEEAPPAVQEAIDKAVPAENVTPFVPETAEDAGAATPRLKHMWWRGMVPLSLVATVVLAIIGIFFMLNSPKLLAQSDDELPAFSAHAAGRAAANSPPLQGGATYEDLQQYLAANAAPLAPKLPGRLGTVTIIGVSADTWSTHRYAYFVLQSATAKLHLFVLNRGEFPNDEVDEDPDRDFIHPYVVEVWSEGPHVFVLLLPAPAP